MTTPDRLSEALAVWRQTWSPRLREIITQLEDPAPPLEATPMSQKAEAERLSDLLATSTDASRGPVLSAFRVLASNALPSNLIAFLDAARAVAPDPRLATLAFELLTKPGTVREVTHRMAEELLDCLRVHGDRGFLAGLAAWQTAGIHPDWGRHLDRVVRALEARVEKPVPPGLFERLPVGARGSQPDATDGAALLEAIFAAPDDDAPRLTWADWLTQHGDERGEFIVLQVARARGGKVSSEARAREKLLLQRNRTAMLGSLADCVALGSLTFSRGFPSSVALTGRVARCPELGLLEHVDFSRAGWVRVPYAALRSAAGVPPHVVHELVESAPRLETLELEVSSLQDLRSSFERASRSLRQLHLAMPRRTFEGLAPVLASALCARLEEFVVSWPLDAVVPPVETGLPTLLSPSELAATPSSLRKVQLVWSGQRGLTIEYQRVGSDFAAARLDVPKGNTVFNAAHYARGLLSVCALETLEVHSPSPLDQTLFERLLGQERARVESVRFIT